MTTGKVTLDLTGLEETALIPLWARAQETQRRDALFQDPLAVDLVKQLDYDFSKFEKDQTAQLGVVVRTYLLDREVSAFIQNHPEASIINLGAGFDTRFQRLDNGRVHWYELDLPQLSAVKSRLLSATDRYHYLSGSVFTEAWRRQITVRDAPVLLIAEGLLMYFTKHKVRGLFDTLVTHFPGAEFLFELLGPALVGKSRYQDSVRQIARVEFKWSLRQSQEIETWNPKIEWLGEWYYTDYFKNRWGWFGQVTRIGWIKRRLSNRIVKARFRG